MLYLNPLIFHLQNLYYLWIISIFQAWILKLFGYCTLYYIHICGKITACLKCGNLIGRRYTVSVIPNITCFGDLLTGNNDQTTSHWPNLACNWLALCLNVTKSLYVQREYTVRNKVLYTAGIAFYLAFWLTHLVKVVVIIHLNFQIKGQIFLAMACERSLFRNLFSLCVDTIYWHGLLALRQI